jgi:hypothetical protein
MTKDDQIAAGNALINWFQSQDIMPADAGMIMSQVIARQFVNNTRDILRLEEAVKLQRILLVLDIADCLRVPAR